MFIHYVCQNQIVNSWYSNPEWWSAIGTIFVGLVAIAIAFLQERIRRFLTKTKLDIILRLEPPDCHKIKITDKYGIFLDSYYVRSRLTNSGQFPAENIEVMIDSVYKIANGKREILKSFLPMNLVWSHYGGITMKAILPKHFRHVDLGYFILNSKNKVIFKIDTAIQPNKVEGNIYPNVLDSGEYELNLIIGGDNVNSTRKSYYLSFNDNFYNKEEDMFSKSVLIKEL